ncbi:hydrogenase maturation protease [Pontibacter ruber]|uniref:Hydrogenase maturation protease n=1 Tax=Pontibacter ruber TaxID=1343895 RepID=A0ABW5D1I6_9BACT|nr:hydrogenase maturation protease [Pontibacter ruber]
MKKQEASKTLLIGIGNSGREDDGLGWAFVEQVEQSNFFDGDCQYRFQLNLEDAELISHYEQVIFVDAHQGELAAGFLFSNCEANAGTGFSTHQLLPESALYLCQQLYEKVPQAWVMAIQGHQWQLKEGLSQEAQNNLGNALAWFRTMTGKLSKTFA